MKGLVAAAAAAACLLGLPAIAQAAEPPPGCGEVDEPRVPRARVPDAAGITEGKFDRVGRHRRPGHHRALRLQDVRRQRSRRTRAARRLPAARGRRERLLAERGHGARHAPQADHRRARPAPQRARPDRLHRLATATRSPSGVQERLLRHLLRRPGEPAPGRRLRRAAVRPHLELHPGLPLHLDRRPGAHEQPRARLARPDLRLGAGDEPARRRRPADLGHRPAQPARPEGRPTSPIDLWRNDGYTDYSHDVDEDDQGIAWVSGRGGVRGYATSGRHRDPYQNRVRRATPFDPILVAGGGVAGTRAARDADAQLGPPDRRVRARPPGSRRATSWSGRRRTSTTPCEHERQDRPLRPHRLVGRRARAAARRSRSRTG